MDKDLRKPLGIAKMKIIIVEGATCTGKTAVIKRAMIALQNKGLKVKHIEWPENVGRFTVKQYVDKSISAACDFDAQTIKLKKSFDVVICDSHPIITNFVKYPDWVNPSRLWQTLTKPHAVLLLNCQPNVIKQRAAAKDKLIGLNDIVNQLDGYADLSAAQVGTMQIHRANVSDNLGLLLASGDLVRIVESLVGAA